MLRERIEGILSWSRRPLPTGLTGAAKVAVICLALLLPILAITCTRNVEKLHGTWINVNPLHGGYKWILNPDGTASYFNRDGTIHTEGRFVIEKKWTDAEGNTWYKTREKWNVAPYVELGATPSYTLAKVDRSGKTLESDGGIYGAPDDFSVSGPVGIGAHQLFTRQ